ncbi:MAG: serine hydrolase [Lachnospiraceae bacterium]|nr:serine hydrolase [Lachnospiraceae bacterium]
MPYTADSPISSFRIVDKENEIRSATGFAEDLCVVDSDITPEELGLSDHTSAGLFDLNAKNTIYAKNIHETLNPASLTKVMTAVIALENGQPDDLLTASENVKITEEGAQMIGLKPGDTMTLDQALHLLLIYSANDVAVLIAEGVGGSVDEFVNMMNEEAHAIGATNTHFSNPHGLTDENHYTTPYDLYLIMNDAIRYELFNEIIHMRDYQTVYHTKDGKEKEANVETTNYYLSGNTKAPSGITVIGGKTGTTNAAGHCLILLSRDTGSNPYISIIMKSGSRDDLYSYMTKLLELAAAK